MEAIAVPPSLKGATAYSSGPTVSSSAGAGVRDVPLPGATAADQRPVPETEHRALSSPSSSAATTVLKAPQGLRSAPSVLGKRQGEVGSLTVKPKPKRPRPTAVR